MPGSIVILVIQLHIEPGPHYYLVIPCSCDILHLLRLLGGRWLGLGLHVAVLSPENQPVEILSSLFFFIKFLSFFGPLVASCFHFL